MDKRKLILEFIKKNKIAVLSYVNENGGSSSAVLEFGETDNSEIIFDTFNSARKYKGIKNNNKVSFVIGWDENITVQLEGIASEVYEDEKEKYQEIYFQKNPDARRWASREGMTYFIVKPNWIRYSDLNKNPWEIHELNFK